MSPHERALELAATALDFELSRPEQEELARHLQSCVACRRATLALQVDALHLRNMPTLDAPDRVRARVREAAGGRGGTSSRLAFAALGAAAVLVALVLVTGTLRAPRTPVPGQAQSPSTAAATTPGTTPTVTVPPSATPAPTPSGLRWQAVPGAVQAFARSASPVIAGGPRGVVAIGADRSSGRPLVWVSADARTWNAVSVPAETFGGQMPTRIVAGEGGYVAVGWTAAPRRRSLWFSNDGRTWRRATNDISAEDWVDTTGLAASGRSFALLGLNAAGERVVWVSSDGRSWSRIGRIAAFGNAPVEFLRGTRFGYVAAGRRQTGRYEIWRSRDGRTWSRVDHDFANRELGPLRVVDAGQTLLAYRAVNDTTRDRPIWRSIDEGETWHDLPAGTMPGRSSTLVGAADRYLAYLGVASDGTAVAWVSSDGVSWAPLSTNPAAYSPSALDVTVRNVTEFGSGWVVTGTRGSSTETLVWLIAP